MPNGGMGVTRGPRMMVVGPLSSGKTTVLKNLVNLALGTGMGWEVAIASLDPSSVSVASFRTGRCRRKRMELMTACKPHSWLALTLTAHPTPPHAPPCAPSRFSSNFASGQYPVWRCVYHRMVVRSF